jgi:hypothetical protein
MDEFSDREAMKKRLVRINRLKTEAIRRQKFHLAVKLREEQTRLHDIFRGAPPPITYAEHLDNIDRWRAERLAEAEDQASDEQPASSSFAEVLESLISKIDLLTQRVAHLEQRLGES